MLFQDNTTGGGEHSSQQCPSRADFAKQKVEQIREPKVKHVTDQVSHYRDSVKRLRRHDLASGRDGVSGHNKG